MDQQSNEIISTKWIENLALDEINMEESGVINFSEHLDPMHMLETSSIEFMEWRARHKHVGHMSLRHEIGRTREM